MAAGMRKGSAGRRLPTGRGGAFALAGSVFVLLALVTSAASAAVLLHEDFRGAGTNGLPPGWAAGPPANVRFFTTAADTAVFGAASPSLRVELPPHTLNYRVASRSVAVPATDSVLTLEVSLRLQMPDSPFLVEIASYPGNQVQLRTELLDLPGENMSGFHRYRISFPNVMVGHAGSLQIFFGLSYAKTFRQGTFWIDDLELREGRETGPFEMYLNPESVAAGGNVGLHFSCASGQVNYQVYREAGTRIPVLGPVTVSGLGVQPVPAQVSIRGCGWPVSSVISTGADWPSGSYTVVADDGERTLCRSFVVRGRGGDGRVLVILPTHTWQAYNDWGGRSFYSASPADTLSFDRPYASSLIGPYCGAVLLFRWLTHEGIPFAVATDSDLNDFPDLLLRYPGVITCMHAEYWTRNMRSSIERYADAGGCVLFLGGNNCWWQTRFEAPDAGGRRLVCFKYDIAHDPMLTVDPALTTTRWDEEPLNDPPTRLFGLSWRWGGLVNDSSSSSCPCRYDWLIGYGGYRVYHTDHWVFDGTGLAEGDSLGHEDAIAGYEVDGTRVAWIGGRPELTGDVGTPPDFRVLGYTGAWSYLRSDTSGCGIMGIVERGRGFIFDCGTVGWCWGLPRDPGVEQVTRNLIQRLPSAAPRLSGAPAAGLRIVPNPATQSVTILAPLTFVPDSPLGLQSLQVFGVDGRRVASLPTRWYSPLRSEATWDLRDAAGEPLPAGVYWVRIPGASARLVRLK